METDNGIAASIDPVFWASLTSAAVIALIHLFTPRLRFIRNPDGAWLPVSVGVVIAYVFVDLFPHLAKAQSKLSTVELSGFSGFLANHIYLISLAGFSVFLGIAMWVSRFRIEKGTADLTFFAASARVKFECASLTAYNFLIGYILAEHVSSRPEGVTGRPEPVLLFGAAMAIHFAGLDGLFRENFQKLADQTGRYLLAAGLMAGWASGLAFAISPAWLIACYAFLGGGIIVVATVHELPEIRSSRQYWQFFAGAGIFSALIFAIETFG